MILIVIYRRGSLVGVHAPRSTVLTAVQCQIVFITLAAYYKIIPGAHDTKEHPTPVSAGTNLFISSFSWSSTSTCKNCAA